MTYFKMDGIDYSQYVNELTVEYKHTYNAQTNAAGNTVVDLINTKREIEVGIIPLNDTTAKKVLEGATNLVATISFLDPVTGAIAENVKCIIPQTGLEYYTIQAENIMLKAFKLKFTEM